MEIEKKQEGFKREITYRKLTVDDFQASKLPEYTSLYFDPKAQRWWLDRVEEQLFKTTPKINFNPPAELLSLPSLVSACPRLYLQH
jgi:hypothetical protein